VHVEGTHGSPASDRRPVVAMVALSVLALAAYMVAGRHVGFFYDEWDFVLGRQAWTADAVLQPHNEHISVLPVLAYKALFDTVGLHHHWPYRALLALLYAGCGLVVFLLARRRVGGWMAVVAGGLVLVMGRAAENILWAFQIGFVGSVLGGLLALLALDQRSVRGDRLACAALVAAALCSSLGVPFAIGVSAELLARRRWRALWIPGVSLVMYAVWWVGFGRGRSHVTVDSATQAVTWSLDAAAAAAGGAAGLSVEWGRVLLVLLVVVIAVRVARAGRISPRLAGLAVTAAVFWVLTGAARSLTEDPATSRYMTLGAVVILLIAMELVDGWEPPGRALGLGCAVVIVAALAGLPSLRSYAHSLRDASRAVDAELAAMSLVRSAVPSAFQPDPTLAPQITAGPYFAAVDRLGSAPADTPAALRDALNTDRAHADLVLQRLVVRAAPAGPRNGRSCRRVAPGATGLAVLGPSGVIVEPGGTSADVRVERFSDGFVNPPIALPRATRRVLVTRSPDASDVPYHVQITAPRGALICRG